MHGRTYKTGGKDSIVEKDPEIALIEALNVILESEDFKSCTDLQRNRAFKWFSDKYYANKALNEAKPAPEKHPDLGKAAKRYIDFVEDAPKPKVLGPSEDDYGRKPRPLFDITCGSIPLPPSTLTDGKGQQNLGLSYLEDC